MSSISDSIVKSAKKLSNSVDKLIFSLPTHMVYNPLKYAWNPHQAYLKKHADSPKQVIFLGMNPGPWGMAQTGVPFGEISLVKDWVGISESIEKPSVVHEKRPIEGFDCKRSEVSGRRLWGLFQGKYGSAESFFKEHFVANYCPLVFMEESGKNRTPDKLLAAEKKALFDACDSHFRDLVKYLNSKWVIGVGAFAEQRAIEALDGVDIKIGRILHPSPASPGSNKDWPSKVTKQLKELGIW